MMKLFHYFELILFTDVCSALYQLCLEAAFELSCEIRLSKAGYYNEETQLM